MALLHLCNLIEDATRLSADEVLKIREKVQRHQGAADGCVFSLPDDGDNLYLAMEKSGGWHWFKIAASKVPVT